jgi:hypothetical protein
MVKKKKKIAKKVDTEKNKISDVLFLIICLECVNQSVVGLLRKFQKFQLTFLLQEQKQSGYFFMCKKKA